MTIVGEIRKLLGDPTWRYDMESGCWTNGEDRILKCARNSPKYDGDDDSFVTEYWLQKANGESIKLLLGTSVFGTLFIRK